MHDTVETLELLQAHRHPSKACPFVFRQDSFGVGLGRGKEASEGEGMGAGMRERLPPRPVILRNLIGAARSRVIDTCQSRPHRRVDWPT